MSKARLIGKHKKTMIFWGVTGAVVGAVSGFYFSPVGQILWSILGADIYIESTTFILLGTALGAAAAVIIRWFRSSVIIIESVPIKVPFLGEITLKFDERQRNAGWRIYVEVSTRITAQALEPGSGLLREAMNSLHALFNNVRRELKHAGGPTPSTLSGEPTVEQLALRILNRDIRPFLAKWHPCLREWERANPDRPEGKWPEVMACRAALEAMQEGVTKDCAELARLIGMNPPSA